MAPTVKFYRIWCKTCNSFELHRQEFNHNINEYEYVCRICDTVFSEILLKDIPKEKVLEQRKRYIDWKTARNREAYSMFMMGGYGSLNYNPIADLFNEDWDKPEIHESDAGQKRIDDAIEEENRQKREAIRIEREKEKELVKQYSGLQRNDICICGKLDEIGNHLKYKKCCWQRIESYK